MGLVGTARRRTVSPRSRASRGFTLIEILVAIVIAAVALAMVSINGLPGARQTLRYEADRLAQLLVLAREESQLRGAPIRLEADDLRFRFIIYRDRQWRPVLDDPDLRERPWQQPTRLLVARPDGRAVVEFGRDSVDAPFRITLARDGETVAILANGLGAFEVQ